MTTFREFQTTYKPDIRPEGLMKRVRYALQIDSQFTGAFGAIIRELRGEIDFWPDKIVLQLMQYRKLDERFGGDQMDILRGLFKVHRAAILSGKFEDDYFASLEDLALFFIYHDIRAIWVVGAFKKAICETIETIAGGRQAGGRSAAYFTMLNFLVLELDQIQRVYVRYAEVTGAMSNDPTNSVTLAG